MASGHAPKPMPVPANLDYEHWLGSAPEQPYMEGRVHPQVRANYIASPMLVVIHALAGTINRARFYDVGVPEGYREAVATFPPRV